MAHRRRVWFGANSSDRPEVTYELASFMHVHFWWDFVLKERKQKTKIMSFRHSALHVHTLYKTRSYATHIFIVFISFFFLFCIRASGPTGMDGWSIVFVRAAAQFLRCEAAVKFRKPNHYKRKNIPNQTPTIIPTTSTTTTTTTTRQQ